MLFRDHVWIIVLLRFASNLDKAFSGGLCLGSVVEYKAYTIFHQTSATKERLLTIFGILIFVLMILNSSLPSMWLL